jgi:hypothetical protein
MIREFFITVRWVRPWSTGRRHCVVMRMTRPYGQALTGTAMSAAWRFAMDTIVTSPAAVSSTRSERMYNSGFGQRPRNRP